MKRMLVNATTRRIRVTLVDGQSIYDFDLEQLGQEEKRNLIYIKLESLERIEQKFRGCICRFWANLATWISTYWN